MQGGGAMPAEDTERRRDLAVAALIIAALVVVFVGSWIKSLPPPDGGHIVLIRNERAVPIVAALVGDDRTLYFRVDARSVSPIEAPEDFGPVQGLFFDGCEQLQGVLFSGRANGDAWSDYAMLVAMVNTRGAGLLRPDDLARWSPEPLPEAPARPLETCGT